MSGKTTILERYVNDIFYPEYKATEGGDFRTKNEVIKNKNVLLQIWDFQGRDRSISSFDHTVFYKGAHVVILVFDLSKEERLPHQWHL